MSKQIHWPDGTKGHEPKDGFTYWLGADLWTYDGFKGQWFRVNTVNMTSSIDQIDVKLDFAQELYDTISPAFDKCECGSEAVGSDVHSNYCPKASVLNV